MRLRVQQHDKRQAAHQAQPALKIRQESRPQHAIRHPTLLVQPVTLDQPDLTQPQEVQFTSP